MIRILFNPDDYKYLIYFCEVIFVTGLVILSKEIVHKKKLKNIVKPKWLFTILLFGLMQFLYPVYSDSLITYTDKKLLDILNVPQIFNFLIQELKAEQGDIFINTISINNRNNNFKNQKYIFVLDRTDSQKIIGEFDTIDSLLRNDISNTVLNNCNTLINNEENNQFLLNAKYGEFILLYAIGNTYRNTGESNVQMNVASYLGNKECKFVNDKVSSINECTIIKDCINHLKTFSITNNVHNSYYSVLMKKVYETNIVTSEEDTTCNVILTIIGDFASEETNPKKTDPNFRIYDTRNTRLKEELEKISNHKSIKKVRIIVLPNRDPGKVYEKNINETKELFLNIFSDRLKIIPLDSIDNIEDLNNELSNSSQSERINAYFKKRESQNPICKLVIQGGKYKKYAIKNLCDSKLIINTHNHIITQDTKMITLKSDTITLELPVGGIHKITISENGVAIPIEIELVELIPKNIAFVFLIVLIILFSVFFFRCYKNIYIPIFNVYKYRHRIYIYPRLPFISIKESDFIAFWASTGLIICVVTILQLLQLLINNIYLLLILFSCIPFSFWITNKKKLVI